MMSMPIVSKMHLSEAERWQAVLERSTAAKDYFVYAVKTTGIYCRSNCPSKRPKRQNVVFYATAEEAEANGYRPCKRCRPNEIDRLQQLVAQVQHLLETQETEPSLSELAEAVGMSSYYVQRVFKRATVGVCSASAIC